MIEQAESNLHLVVSRSRRRCTCGCEKERHCSAAWGSLQKTANQDKPIKLTYQSTFGPEIESLIKTMDELFGKRQTWYRLLIKNICLRTYTTFQAKPLLSCLN